ncbi:class I SAM-dependent methyltransferase [Salibacterium salarium]|uniref:Class I SAM-dependent methyltransferase n=1 Tax=Salibacterium salarium TaxID=284579 RepID=A0A428NAJ4_9BACI|nr:class I SAM-dependent methyltransferase [Salibacterium salarium]RSL35404.1 class I SAM-dependent methyltransferase [Salibacterium salarium]
MSKEFWDDVFSDKDFVYGKKVNTFINTISDIIPAHSNIACFAEGEGRNAVYLAKNGHDVTSYDQSDIALEKTKELAVENNVDINVITKDLTKEKVETNVYDAAVMIFGHVPREDQPFFMKNIVESVKSGGYIIFEVYSESQLQYQTGGPPSIEMLYNPIDILNWMEGYKFLHFYYGETNRNEGKKHTGLCHVIQAAVIKK